MNAINRSFALIIALVVAVTFIGINMLPGRFERIEMLHRESRFQEAMELLSNLPLNQMTNFQVAQAGRLYNDAGHVGLAIALFEGLRDAGRIDTVGLETLAYYYGEGGRLADSHRTLATLASDHLNESDSRRTLEYFRAYNMIDQELGLAEIMFRRDFLNVAERLRLAKVYHHAGDTGAALNVLRSITKMDSGELTVFEVRTTVEFLNRVGLPEETQAFLSSWINSSLNAPDLVQRFDMLMFVGADALVADVAKPLVSTSRRIRAMRRNAVYNLRNDSDVRRQDYIELLLSELGEPLSVSQAEERLYEVYAFLPADAAFEQLNFLAPRDAKLSRKIYYDRLRKAGRTMDLARLMMEDFEATPAAQVAQRIEIADEIASIDVYSLAADAYEDIAIEAGPESGVVERLFYAWKAAGETNHVEWMGTRLLNSDASDYESWEKHFFNADEAGVLLDWLEQRVAPSNIEQMVWNTKVQLARWERNSPRLKPYLLVEFDRTPRSATQARLKIADEISALGHFEEAADAYEMIVSVSGFDGAAVEKYVFARTQIDGKAPLSWLGGKLLSSSSADYAQWEAHFLTAESPTKLLDWLEQNAPSQNASQDIWQTKSQLAIWEPGLRRLEPIINAAIMDGPISRVNALRYYEVSCEYRLDEAVLRLERQLSTFGDLPIDQKLCAARAATRQEDIPLGVSYFQELYDQGYELELVDLVEFAKAKSDLTPQANVSSIYEDAMAKFKPMDSLSSSDLVAQAFVLQQLEKREEAAQTLEFALSSNPSERDALKVRILLSQIYTELGKYQRVLELSCSQMGC